MSDKWETVKPKPAPSGKSNSKKAVPKPMPKLEDVLPAGSIQAMYTDYEPAPVAEVKKVPSTPKKEQKKTVVKKDVVPAKPKVPKNIQEAVKMNLRLDDLKQLVESCQKKFPESPLLWLRDLAAYLNLKLVNEDKSEVGVFEGAPLSALTQNMKKLMYSVVQGVTESMLETYLETCLSNTAHDLAKGLDVDGWRVMTQVILDINPGLITSNLSRLVELRNSYQNRPNVGLALLWSVGQAGKKDLQSGVKIWLEMMLPVISMKHYTRFVVEYLGLLLNLHRITKDTVLSKPVMDLQNFVTVQDTVFLVSGQLSKDCGKQLRDLYPQLRAAALAGSKNHEIFPTLMDKLKNQNMPDQVLDSLEVLANCLLATPAALVHWQRVYTSHLSQSGQLVQYLDSNWSRYRGLQQNPEFQETIQAFQDYNISATHKDDIGLCRDGCAALLANMAKGEGAWFPWKTLSFLLLIATASIINLDIQKNGEFSRSHSGAFFKDIGQYDRLVDISSRAQVVYGAGYSWTETNVPVYYAKLRSITGPALDNAVEQTKEYGVYVYGKGGEGLLLLQDQVHHMNLVLQDQLVQVGAQLPGLKQRAGEFIVILQQGFNTCQEKVVMAYTEVVGGKVDWGKVQENVLIKISELQISLKSGLDWTKNQINQLIK